MTVDVRPASACALAQALSAASSVSEAEAAIAEGLPAPVSHDHGLRGPAFAKTTPETIGLWRRVSTDAGTIYRRDTTLDDDNFWSAAEEIGPKTCTRVVLLGESVARGVFLDPFFNCAQALGSYLDALCGAGQVEIVDLARSGLTPSMLLRLVHDVAVLEPDAVVIFAGNNWPLQPGAVDRAAIAGALAAGADRWSELAPYFRDAVRRQVAAGISALAGAARARSIPLLFVIPANNVRDTAYRMEWYDPFLPTPERLALEQELTRAQDLLAREEYGEASEAAARILERGSNSSIRALWIAGACALARHDTETAMRYFDAMEDACLPLPANLSCGALLCEAIRDAAAAEGLATVSVRELFLEAHAGVPPGRELFLDPVHLTADGIRLAMAAVTERLLTILGRPAARYTEIAGIPIHVDPRAVAQGHFVAALLHWRRDQTHLVAYHARLAVASGDEMAVLLRSMVRMMVSQVPEPYYDAYARLAEAAVRFPGLRLLLYLIPEAASQPVYLELARTLAAAVEPVLPGTVDECERLLRQTSLREGRPVSLLRHAFRDELVFSWLGRDRAFVRAYSDRTELRLQCDAERDVRCEVTARCGKDNRGDRDAALSINGQVVHRWRVDCAWGTTTCTVPAGTLRPGVNEVCILWPDPRLTRADRVRALVEMFRAGYSDATGLLHELFPVYGDVYAFDVTVPPRER